jgi:phage terminase small subunit
VKQEEAYNDYCNGMKYKDIAVKYGVSLSTIKSWKIRNKWVRTKIKSTHPKSMHQKMFQSVDCNGGLTEKQRLFCLFYATSNNATQSYIKAYQCDKTSAMVEGCKHLRNPKVADEIKRLRDIMRQDFSVDMSDMVRYCLKVVGADIGDYVKFGRQEVPLVIDGHPVYDKNTGKQVMETINYVELNDSCVNDTSVIDEVRQGKAGISIKMADKKWAWDKLAKLLGFYPEDKHKDDYDQKVLELKERLVKVKEF